MPVRNEGQLPLPPMGETLGSYFDFPVVFGEQLEILVSAFLDHRTDNFIIVNIFYNFARFHGYWY